MGLLNTLFGTKPQQSETITILTAAEFESAIQGSDIQLVDVRTPKEFKEGAIKNAQNIDFFQKEKFVTAFNNLDKQQPVYLYCRSGNRSQQAAVKLDSMGFKKIYDLKGGYMAWPHKN